MRSKTSFFNPTVYRKNLTRFAPLWLAYTAFWLVAMPLNILSNREHVYRNMFDVWDLLETVLRIGSYAGVVVCAVYALFVAMAFHGWYYQTRNVNALAALPIRREAWFITNLVSALTVGLLPHLLVALCSWLSAAALGLAGFSAALQWLAIVSLFYIFFYALSTLCAAVVGQILALPVLYFLVNFTAVVVNYFVVQILETFVYGMNGSRTALSPLSPIFHVLSRTQVEIGYADETAEGFAARTVLYVRFIRWGYLLGLTAAALIFLAAAFLLFRRRRMEAAGDTIAVAPLRPVFKYVFAAGCALVLGSLVAELFFEGREGPSVIVMSLCLLAGGFIGYFTAEILLKKTFHVFQSRAWAGFGIFSAALVALVLLMEFDVTGYERRVPAAGNVASLRVDCLGRYMELEDPAYIADFIALHQSLIDEKAGQEAIEYHISRDRIADVSACGLELSYRLKNGRSLTRSYTVYCTEEEWASGVSPANRMDALLNEPALALKFYEPSFPVTDLWDMGGGSLYNEIYNIFEELGSNGKPSVALVRRMELTQAEAWELYTTCLLPDLRDGKIGRRDFFRFSEGRETEYAARINVEFSARRVTHDQVLVNGSYTSYIDLTLTVGSRTAQYFLDRGVPLITWAQYSELMEQIENGEDVNLDLNTLLEQ